MTIVFKTNKETQPLQYFPDYWCDAKFIPRVGERIMLNNTLYKVQVLTWVEEDYIELELVTTY